MDKDKFFDELEHFLENLNGKKLPETLKVTIYYSTGENETFNVSDAFWANALVATKKRLKYTYFNNRLINLDHVVKMHFEELDTIK
ncbi:MAG: hypothetical protein ABTA16_03420 [Niallia sp.]